MAIDKEKIKKKLVKKSNNSNKEKKKVKSKKEKNELKSRFKEKYTKLKDKQKETYTTREVIVIMLFSIGIGILLCFGCFSFITGKNYFKVTKDLSKVVDTYYAITDNYYGDLDKNALIDGAIEGMISSVGDSYTSYADTQTTEDFTETISGSYEGIGCSIATYLEEGKTVVIEVFPDSPAEKAGLEVGDIISKVDGKTYETSGDISKYIKNSGKEKVKLLIIRDNEEKEITINLSKVNLPYVTGKVLEKNDKKVGYISISLFSSNSYENFKKELKKLEKENIDSLIIDVRSNNGGYLTAVTDITSMFLEKGKIIYQLEDSNGTVKKKDITKEKRTYKVAVLINGESASASEILASAIKESYNGYVVGTNSYGKGTVQQTKKLLDGSMIKYTIQKWLSPEGNFIGDVGVEPTNKVEQSDSYYDNPTMENDSQLNEALNILTK